MVVLVFLLLLAAVVPRVEPLVYLPEIFTANPPTVFGHQRRDEDMLCPGSWRGSVLAQGREHCAPRKRCYQSRPYGGVSAECARKRRAAANTTRDVQVPQREHPAIAMRLQVDFHSGSATAALRSEGTAGVGKVTLATQCDSEVFVRRLPELARAWQGPMVVAVLVRTWDEAQNVTRALRGSPVLSKWADVHLLGFAFDKDNLGATLSLRNFLRPDNFLRNVASQLVMTEWTLVMDADLMPNVHAAVFDRHVAHALAYVSHWQAQEKVWVVPSLEWSSDSTGGSLLEWAVPEATPPPEGRLPKRRARCLLSKGAMHPFMEGGLQSMESALELASDVTRWMDATQPFELPYRRNTLTAACHVTRSGAPPFDTAFGGGGGDQVEREMVMAAGGFTFHVLPQVFATHRPHELEAPVQGGTFTHSAFIRVQRAATDVFGPPAHGRPDVEGASAADHYREEEEVPANRTELMRIEMLLQRASGATAVEQALRECAGKVPT